MSKKVKKAGKNAKKAGNWVVEYGKWDINSQKRSWRWNMKHRILSFTVNWIPIRYLQNMAYSALQDMVDKAIEKRERRAARAERKAERTGEKPGRIIP